jgi:hypothetical protein
MRIVSNFQQFSSLIPIFYAWSPCKNIIYSMDYNFFHKILFSLIFLTLKRIFNSFRLKTDSDHLGIETTKYLYFPLEWNENT